MPSSDTTAAWISQAAAAAFDHVEQMAEETPNGIRWSTLDYRNEPFYDISIFDGVAGIALFLADYHGSTQSERALELACGGYRWCLDQLQPNYDHSLYFGQAGVAWLGLHLAQLEGQPALPKAAVEIGDRILQEQPGPVTDIMGGAAGKGFYLRRLHQTSGNDQYLAGAVAQAQWLQQTALWQGGLCYWPVNCDDLQQGYALGAGHGIAGIGYFLLTLYASTQDQRWAELARSTASTLLDKAVPDQGGLNWPPSWHGGPAELCQWCHGAPGVGLFFTYAYQVLGETQYLETAQAAGRAVYAHGDIRSNPSQCHGLAGNAELFLELHRLDKTGPWLQYAVEFARRAQSYHSATEAGALWQSDDPGFHSPDFMCGAAGVGHFFLRLQQPDGVPRHFI